MGIGQVLLNHPVGFGSIVRVEIPPQNQGPFFRDHLLDQQRFHKSMALQPAMFVRMHIDTRNGAKRGFQDRFDKRPKRTNIEGSANFGSAFCMTLSRLDGTCAAGFPGI
jgi:hypothetical protein